MEAVYTTRTTNTPADLFELLKNLLCCAYISDLKTEPYKEKAQLLLSYLDLHSFSSQQVHDVRNYIGSSC